MKRISRYTIYLSVEAVMIELFGEKWYEKENKEHIALGKAIRFKEFYQTYERKPSLKLQGKLKEKKENCRCGPSRFYALKVTNGFIVCVL